MSEEMKRLERIIKPVAKEIVVCSTATEGIAFVVHRPGPLAMAALATINIRPGAKETTVFGMSCAHATAWCGHDPVTRRWTSSPPEDDEVKVFLFAGNGTALLTLRFTDKGIMVSTPPNLRLL